MKSQAESVILMHTGECLENQTQAMELIAAWEARWPNYHRACGGQGAYSHYESHGFKGGGREHISEPCTCTESGKCARCGAVALNAETGEGPCTECGWNYDDFLPMQWECWIDCGIDGTQWDHESDSGREL